MTSLVPSASNGCSAALRAKVGNGITGSLGPALSVMGALPGHFNTDLSAIDLLLLSGLAES